ncbi:hypothetical protein [Dactylosporangium sp. CA-092794]|uniref:hypothetical protein n=1 Tax=Dactylosporangium sp. CA-092794 TaxID=3239929 RepID=UPI003D8FD37D
MTMLGASGSGKTTFVLGMYANLVSGRHGYRVHAPNKQHIQLMDSWDALWENGTLPVANDERAMVSYEFSFLRDLETLLVVDWLDYRGGAIRDDETKADAAALIERLKVSHSVYLVLDGRVLGEWIRAHLQAHVAGGPPPNLYGQRRNLRVEDMTNLLQTAFNARAEAGHPPPSIVVVITKQDTLPEITGLAPQIALAFVADRLAELVPVTIAHGVKTMVNPVQLGVLGAQPTDRVQVESLHPIGFEYPFIFTFTEYLAARIDETNLFLETISRQQANNVQEIAVMRSRFGGLFNQGRIGRLNSEQQHIVAEQQRLRNDLLRMQHQAKRLTADLNSCVILRSGQRR